MAKVTKPLGRMSPWVWSVEFVRGCNLKCWHCTARVFPPDHEPRFMSMETWQAACRVMAQATPGTRLELAQGGEPTLHPELLEALRMAKFITPSTQLQVTTNGLTLLAGKVNLRELFDAGASSVYVDMYGPQPATMEKFVAMAAEVPGIEWYKYDKPKEQASNPNHRMANTYYGDPKMRLLILQDNPEYRLRWRNEGRLSTFLNHTDWGVSLPYGLVPVREPYSRKCTLPMRYVSTSYEGDYLFCCIDFWCESAGLLGNVKDGPEAFNAFWFGRLMQSIRRRLVVGDRAGIPYCSRCNCAFSKCDWVRMWPENAYDRFWNGQGWEPMPPLDYDEDVFAPGWEWAEATERDLPAVETEAYILQESTKRIIRSDAASRKAKTAREHHGEGNNEDGYGPGAGGSAEADATEDTCG